MKKELKFSDNLLSSLSYIFRSNLEYNLLNNLFDNLSERMGSICNNRWDKLYKLYNLYNGIRSSLENTGD